jgi:Ca2+-binding RTX toxin-like protein
MTRTSLFAAATAAAALAAFPAVASAAPTAVVNAANKTITITGDDTAEQITVADAGGFITLNGAATTAPADGTFTMTVTAGDGADTVAIKTANLGSVVVNGGLGDDSLTGGPNNDRLIGDDGDDTMAGGNGNDTLVWNPGDDSDTMDGQGGGDDIELNGGSNAENFAAAPNGDRVRFERVSPGAFNLNVGTAERLVLNANGGADTMVSDPALATPVLLNGGDGVDVLQGGGAADFINGGEANDSLDGGPGIDRLVGDRGGDGMAGGAGDDTLVWNNGDGSDVMDGQDGLDKIEVNGSAAAGDVFTLAPNADRVRFDRTNLVPFNLNIGTAELLDLRGLGGDDSFVAAPGTPLAVLADGGDGNDALAGAEEPDTFFGGAGTDTLTGGGGPDLLDGQDGDDTLLSRDGAGDLVRGGLGNDSAQTDSPRIDVVDGVESIDRPSEDDETATPVRVLNGRAPITIDRRGRASTKLRVQCPAAETGGCKGSLTLLSRKSFRIAGVRVRIVIATERFNLTPGQTKRIKIDLPKGVRKLAKNGRIATLAQTVSRDAAGNIAEGSKRVSLTLPKKR